MANVTQARRSTVALKYAMAVSGLIMIAYLLAHMYGNLKIFSGREAFDGYSHHLRELGEPLLPHTGALWIIRVVLLAAVLIHAYAAFTLWSRNRKAGAYVGGKRYHSKQNRKGIQRTYSSFTMRWGGIIVALFIVYHLLHLTANAIHPGGASASPYERVVGGFEIWWVVLSYTIAMVALGLHIRHGFWSAFTTLGQNHTWTRSESALNAWTIVIAVLITVGFLIPPFFILFGWVG